MSADTDATADGTDAGGTGGGSDGGAGDGFLDRLYAGDAKLIVGLLVAVYAAYIVSGAVIGYSLRGQLNSIAVLTFYIGIFAMLGLALNLHWGYTGLFNIGIAGFMAVGIYVMGLATMPPAAPGSGEIGGLGLPVVLGIVIGMLAAALLGLVAALPALRLRADYLAIVTIALSEIVRFSFLSGELQQFTLGGYSLGFGGGSGIILGQGSDPLQAFFRLVGLWQPYVGFARSFSDVLNNPLPVVNGLVYGALLLGFVGLYYWLLKRIGESPFGRVLKAIREDEDVAQALGKNTDLFKIKSFMVGCALMGLAGILWWADVGTVTPNTFRPRITFFVWIALIIGGAGSNTGSVLGGALFAAVLFQGPLYFKNLMDAVLPQSVGSAPPSFGPAIAPLFGAADPMPIFLYTLNNIRQLQPVIMGLVLIWLMHNRPEGILGHRKEIAAAVDLRRPASRSSGDAATDGGERR